jgi:fibronectin-binding autotransporter adhesin
MIRSTGSQVIDGGGSYRIFSGVGIDLSITNCTFQNGLARGGDGADGNNYCGGGGGGAGTGGAVHLEEGSLTLSNCSFNSNIARGGDGGSGTDASSATFTAGGGGGNSLSSGNPEASGANGGGDNAATGFGGGSSVTDMSGGYGGGNGGGSSANAEAGGTNGGDNSDEIGGAGVSGGGSGGGAATANFGGAGGGNGGGNGQTGTVNSTTITSGGGGGPFSGGAGGQGSNTTVADVEEAAGGGGGGYLGGGGGGSGIGAADTSSPGSGGGGGFGAGGGGGGSSLNTGVGDFGRGGNYGGNGGQGNEDDATGGGGGGGAGIGGALYIGKDTSLTVQTACVFSNNSTEGGSGGGGLEPGSNGQAVANDIFLYQGASVEFNGASNYEASYTIDAYFPPPEGFEDGGVIKSGTNTVTLSGENSYVGGTSITGGTLSVSQNSNLGNTNGGISISDATLALTASFNHSRDVALSGTSTISVSTDVNSTFSGFVSGSGTLAVDGDGTLTLTSFNTYTGGTSISSAGVVITDNRNLGNASGSLTFDGGTLQTTADVESTRATTLNAGGGGLSVNTGTTHTFNGAITGNGGLAKTGDGTLILNGTNNYSGGTNLSAGTIHVGTDTRLGSGTLTFLGGTLSTVSATHFDIDNAIALSSSGTVTNAGDIRLTGVISGGDSASLTKSGAGTLTLTNMNTYSGGTTISGGTLVASSSENIGTGLITLNNGTFQTEGNIPSNERRIAVIGDTGSTFSSGAFNSTFGTLSGTGNLTKTGSGTLTLDQQQSNFYSGAVDISEGTLRIEPADTSITFGGNITGSGALEAASTNTVVFSGDLESFTGGIKTLGGTIAFSNSSGTTTIDNDIIGAGSIAKQGAGTLVLSGTNSYGNGTTVSAGTLSISEDANLGDGAGSLTLSGGTLAITGDINTSRALTISGSSGISTGTNSYTQSGSITGTSSLAKTGSGTLTLLGANNTYTGSIEISEGTVAFSESSRRTLGNSISGSGTLSKIGTGMLTVPGSSLDSFSGAISVSAGTFDLSVSSDQSLSNSVSGSGTFTKSGTGTLSVGNTLSGLTGDVEVLNGQLTFTNTSTGGNVIVESSGTLRGTGTIGNNLVVSGAVRPGNSVGTINISGDLTLNNSSTTTIELEDNESSKFIVSGSAAVDGTLVVTPTGSNIDPSSIFTIITAASLSGEFDTFNPPAQFPNAALSYTATSVLLDLGSMIVIPTSIVVGRNNLNLANYLNANSSNSLLTSTVEQLGALSAGPLNTALTSISPLRNSNATFSNQITMFTYNRLTSMRMAEQRVYDKINRPRAYDSLALVADNCETPQRISKTAWCRDQNNHGWVSAFGQYLSFNDKKEGEKFDAAIGGTLIAFDRVFRPGVLGGIGGGYAYNSVTDRTVVGNSQDNLGTLNLYGSLYNYYGYLEAALWGTFNDVQTERTVEYTDFEGIAKGRHDVWQITPHIGAGYNCIFCRKLIEPFVSFDGAVNFEQAYQESGAGSLNMAVESSVPFMLRSEIGIRGYEVRPQTHMTIRTGLSYVNLTPFGTGDVTAAVVGVGGSFFVEAFNKSQNLIAPHFDLIFDYPNSKSFFTISYLGEFGNYYINNDLMVKCGWRY